MLSFGKFTDSSQILDAISKSQAVIQFDLTGNLLMISASNQHVKTVSRSSARPARHWSEILVQVQDVHVNVTTIVEAAREQSTGLCEINQSVNSMDHGDAAECRDGRGKHRRKPFDGPRSGSAAHSAAAVPPRPIGEDAAAYHNAAPCCPKDGARRCRGCRD